MDADVSVRTLADDVSLVRGGVEADEGLGQEGLPFEFSYISTQ
jgi:hypothetical protein